MANLVQAHYLHNSEKTFFNYQKQIDDLDINGKNRFPEIIKSLNNLLVEAEALENRFYKDFDVKSKEEWESKYLIGTKGNRTKAQIVLSIINSPSMISILKSGSKGIDKQKKEFIRRLKSSKTLRSQLGEALVNYYINIITNSSTINFGELFKEMGLLGTSNSGGAANIKKLSNFDIQKYIFKNAKMKNLPTRTLSSTASDYIKQLERELISNNIAPEQAKMNNAVNYLKQSLQREGFSQTEIDIYAKAWRIILQRELKPSAEKRLLSYSLENVTGDVSESGEVVAYIDISNPFSNDGDEIKINSMVEQWGRELVTRNGNTVKSKVDTAWRGKSGQVYLMQNKNTSDSVYQNFRYYNDIKSLPDRFTYLPLQREIELSTLATQLQNYHILNQEEKDTLIYLLTNYNVLSKVGVIAKGNNDRSAAVASKTQAYIDMLLSKGIQYYISDLLPIPSKNGFGDSYSFIIYMDKILIPKSEILRNLIQFIKDMELQNSRIYTSSYIQGFGESQYNAMFGEKIKVIGEELQMNDNVVFDYHNQALVDIGSRYGNDAADGLRIRNISFRFKITDLLNNNFR